MKIYLGQNIKYLRKKHNMRQEDLAKVLHISHQRISNYERGRQIKDFDLLEEIAIYFDVTIDDLIRKPMDSD